MAEITVNDIGLNTTEMALVAASAGGDTFKNTKGNVILILENSSASPVDATVVAQTPCNHGTLHDEVITVPANGSVVVADIEKARFNDEDGMVNLTYVDETAISVGIFEYAG